MSFKYTPHEREHTGLSTEGQFTDAVIKCENVEFKIHKIILCNCSLYFRWVMAYKSLLSDLSDNNNKFYKTAWSVNDLKSEKQQTEMELLRLVHGAFVMKLL